MGTIWIIGWLFAIGIHLGNDEFNDDPWYGTIIVFLCFLIVWPAFIGYVVGRVVETLNPNKKDSSHGKSQT